MIHCKLHSYQALGWPTQISSHFVHSIVVHVTHFFVNLEDRHTIEKNTKPCSNTHVKPHKDAQKIPLRNLKPQPHQVNFGGYASSIFKSLVISCWFFKPLVNFRSKISKQVSEDSTAAAFGVTQDVGESGLLRLGETLPVRGSARHCSNFRDLEVQRVKHLLISEMLIPGS